MIYIIEEIKKIEGQEDCSFFGYFHEYDTELLFVPTLTETPAFYVLIK